MGETDAKSDEPPQRVLVIHNAPAVAPTKGRPEDVVSEREVEEVATAVAEALTRRGVKDVRRYAVTADLVEFLVMLREVRPQVVFNLCEGLAGDESYESLVTRLLEFHGVPFTGARTRAIDDTNDKPRANAILERHGVPVPKGVVIKSLSDLKGFDLDFPVIVKPASENASLGITPRSVVRDRNDLEEPVRMVLEQYHQPALVERFIDGREFNVALMGGTETVVLPVAEIDYSGLPKGLPRILFYEAKWMEDSPVYHQTPARCPAVLKPQIEERIRLVARRAYDALGCTGYARVDLRMSTTGRVHVLEVNCNPSLSPTAGFARSALAAGLEYDQLIERILLDAFTTGRAGVPNRPGKMEAPLR